MSSTDSPLNKIIQISAVALTILIVVCYDLDNMPLFYLNWTLSSIFIGLFVFAVLGFLSLDYALDKTTRPWMAHDANEKDRARRLLHVPFHIHQFLQYFAILTAIGYGINAVTWTIWYYRQDTYIRYFNSTTTATRVSQCGPLFAWQKSDSCGGFEAAYTWFYYNQWPLYLHAIPGGIVLAAGAHQIWWPRGTTLHKWTGYIYVLLEIAAAAGSIALSIISHSVILMSGFLLLALFWIVTLALGMYHLLFSKSQDRIPKHREFMLMNYGATWSAVALRFGSVFGSGTWYMGIPWSIIFPVLCVIATVVYVFKTREKATRLVHP